MYFVYIIQCSDDSLYTGITTDVKRRFSEHQSGRGCNYTRSHKVERVLYTEKCKDRSDAQKRESQIKKSTRLQKLDLIQTKK